MVDQGADGLCDLSPGCTQETDHEPPCDGFAWCRECEGRGEISAWVTGTDAVIRRACGGECMVPVDRPKPEWAALYGWCDGDPRCDTAEPGRHLHHRDGVWLTTRGDGSTHTTNDNDPRTRP